MNNPKKSEGGLSLKGILKTSSRESPLISIVTVVYNGADYLESTIQHVLQQSYKNLEYIIIDGGSTDGTLDIVKKYEHAIDYWLSEPDKGIYDAMNKGILLSNGELIGIVNADDWYELDTVETVVAEYLKNKEVDILHGNIAKRTMKGSFIKIMKPELDMSRIYTDMIFWHPTFFVKNEVYKRIGLFDSRYRVAGDYDFLLRCHKANAIFRHIDKVLTNFRVGGASSSSAYKGFKECRTIAQGDAGNVFASYVYFKRCFVFFLSTIINPLKHKILDKGSSS